jgi:signal transduction histidine kinase
LARNLIIHHWVTIEVDHIWSWKDLAMSRLYEALRKLEDDRQMQIKKDIPPAHELGASDPSDEKTVSLSPLFLVETLRDIKKAVRSIHKIGLLSMEKSDSHEDREHSRMAMTKAYDQIVSTVDMLSSYIHVTSPVPKKNTIHCILEEILESNEKKVHARHIDLKKIFADELPETIFHDEQLRFILNLVLQYAILSTPSGGSIETVTQFVNDQKEQGAANLDPKKSKYTEILISSLSANDSLNQSQGASQVAEIQGGETSHFILRLIKEMIRKNQRMIDFQMEQVKSRTRISLKFPLERRRVAYYRPVIL